MFVVKIFTVVIYLTFLFYVVRSVELLILDVLFAKDRSTSIQLKAVNLHVYMAVIVRWKENKLETIT